MDTEEFPDVVDVLDVPAPPFGRSSFMNIFNVDYDKYPALTKVKLFNIALLGPGKSRSVSSTCGEHVDARRLYLHPLHLGLPSQHCLP